MEGRRRWRERERRRGRPMVVLQFARQVRFPFHHLQHPPPPYVQQICLHAFWYKFFDPLVTPTQVCRRYWRSVLPWHTSVPTYAYFYSLFFTKASFSGEGEWRKWEAKVVKRKNELAPIYRYVEWAMNVVKFLKSHFFLFTLRSSVDTTPFLFTFFCFSFQKEKCACTALLSAFFLPCDVDRKVKRKFH